jgi:hypothetical protein
VIDIVSPKTRVGLIKGDIVLADVAPHFPTSHAKPVRRVLSNAG